MKKYLVFDMDGTIADLYSVENWLNDLRAYNARPYEVALPLCNMPDMIRLLDVFKENGWGVVVTSWSSKESCPLYDWAVEKAKVEWLRKYGFPADEIYVVPYGVSKTSVTAHLGGYQILIDDNEEVRAEWGNGDTIDATEDIFTELLKLYFEMEG